MSNQELAKYQYFISWAGSYLWKARSAITTYQIV
jgi:hypothetical protein